MCKQFHENVGDVVNKKHRMYTAEGVLFDDLRHQQIRHVDVVCLNHERVFLSGTCMYQLKARKRSLPVLPSDWSEFPIVPH